MAYTRGQQLRQFGAEPGEAVGFSVEDAFDDQGDRGGRQVLLDARRQSLIGVRSPGAAK